MNDIAVRINELSKVYKLGTQEPGYTTLRESLARAGRRPFRRFGDQPKARSAAPDLWALKDLSLTVRHGEVLGLIGHNGAGKSTLLKILARITEPTAGWAEVTGRIGSLLEVGTGFHPELTGRENVFLNGAILGMRRPEILRQFDEIVEFAEIESFLDTPVKRYSSGMQVRLAFAVAAHLEPAILLVDEVLAVGDASFQRKSLGKMGEAAKQGKTVIFVSHNLAIIRALCRRGIVLERGCVTADAPVAEAIDHYLRKLEQAASHDLLDRPDRENGGKREIMIKGVEVQDLGGGHRDMVVGGRSAKIVVELTGLLPKIRCVLMIANGLGSVVATFDSQMSSPADTDDPSLGPRIECEIPVLPLLPGRYRLDVWVAANMQLQDGLRTAAFFDVEPGVIEERPMPAAGGDVFEGDVVMAHAWRLPTECGRARRRASGPSPGSC
jgi:homopolymeric O-antigen transport system ATP-binding protein